MRVRINGETAEIESGLHLEALLRVYKLKPEQVVIELNRQVPPKSAWAATALKEGDEVEIVKFLGGG